jgi:pimeloyl-ACP methyl ester carboxylesterase
MTTRAVTRGALQLLGQGVDYVTARVYEVHVAIASRPYDALERLPAARAGAKLVRPLHLGGTAFVYAVIRGTSRVAFAGLDATLAAAGAAEGDGALEGDGGGAATGGGGAPRDGGSVLSAVLGEHLAREGNPLAVRMALCVGGADLPLGRAELSAALPGATGRAVVFVHGLGCDETSWGNYSERLWGRPGVSYGAQLAERLGYTPLFVRYNTGLRVADNGRALAALLEQFVASYPAPLERLALVGHSMGGLVARSACHHALGDGRAWPALVSDVFCLGSPHLGAPLERLGARATAALGAHPITAPFGRLADGRGAGIKGLADGAVAEGDEAALPPNARVHLVAGALDAADGPLARWLGDGVVPAESARGEGRLEGLRATFPFTHHGHLLNHPLVCAHLERHLA